MNKDLLRAQLLIEAADALNESGGAHQKYMKLLEAKKEKAKRKMDQLKKL